VEKEVVSLNGQKHLFDESELKMISEDFEEEMDKIMMDESGSELQEVGEEETESDTPTIGSPEWNNFVLSHFQPDELYDGNPICSGLRRVAELLLGDIVESGPSVVFPPTSNDHHGRATVVYKVVFLWRLDGSYSPRTFSEAADVWEGNTDDMFCVHPVATASTRAEGRALRKALKIKGLAAEELSSRNASEVVRKASVIQSSDGDFNPEERVSSQQINFIDTKCKQLDINVMKFVNSGKKDYGSISRVTKETGSMIIRELNKLQGSADLVSEEIKGYEENWRDQ
jgi:hypothetical protein